MARLTRKKFTNISAAVVGKMNKAELRELLRGARQLYNIQEEKFGKYEDTVWSPALDKMQDYYERNTKRPLSRMNMSKMRNEILHLQEFFNSQTSTIPGARKVALEQDKRIFGVDSSGKVKKRMTLEQRTSFWAAYNEFKSMQSEQYVRNMGSNTIQEFLGQMMLQDTKRRTLLDYGFTAGDFEELKKRLEKQREEEDWEMSNYEYGDDEVFSGNRPY